MRFLLLASCLLAIASGCGPAEPPPLTRLFDQPGIELAPMRSQSRVFAAAAGDATLRPLSLRRGENLPALPPPALVDADGYRFVELDPKQQVLACSLRILPGSRYRMTATVRAHEPSADAPLLALETSARVALDPPPKSLMALIASRLVTARHAPTQPPRAGTFEHIECEWQSGADAGGVILLIGASSSGLAAKVDFVSLVLERVVEHAPTAIPEVAIGGDYRRAQLLPAGGRLRVRTVVPSAPATLELAAGRPEDESALNGAPLTLTVVSEAAGQTRTLATQTLDARNADDDLWQPLRIELTALAGTEVVLEFAVSGAAGAHLAVAEPLVVCAPARRTPNILLISIDTLRADRLSCYGYQRKTSPWLDAFAQQSVVFEQAQSHANYTLPSHVTMLSGQPPTVHGVLQPRLSIAPGETRLLAEQLRANGYLTAAFTGGGFLHPRFGFASGFDRYVIVDPMLSPTDPRWRTMPSDGTEERNARLHAHYRLDHALAWLHEHRTFPFFLFLHTYRVHNYAPDHDTMARLQAESSSKLSFDAIQHLLEPDNPGADDLGSADVELLSRSYDATIEEVDADLRALFDALARENLLQNTIVAITADHGEEFRDHGNLFHNRTLYQEMLHVPLIIHAPGLAPAHIATPIGLVDLVPTLLDLAALPPLPSACGRSLRPLCFHEDLGAEPLLAEHQSADGSVLAIRFGSMKLLHVIRAHADREELYDLEQDPRETKNRFATDGKNAARMKLLLSDRHRELRSRRVTGVNEANLPEELQAQLRGLGYFGK